MLTVIKKGTPIKEKIKKVQQVVSRKQSGLQSSKYLGILKAEIDPISFQQKIRDEWN